MQFLLIYHDAASGHEERLAFEASGFPAAFRIADELPIGERAVLLQDGKPVCRKERDPRLSTLRWVL